MLKVIAAIIKIVLLVFAEWRTADAGRKKKLAEARKGLETAVKTRDPSEITKAFDRAKRA